MAISLKGKMSIGSQFEMNNGLYNNMIGRQQPCFFIVEKKGILTIGDNVGISATAIVCSNSVVIEDNVRIGGGTVIYDTDFHSLNYKERIAKPEIRINIKTVPVIIKRNAFIGSNCTILKGVTIGENSIVGASSVVSKNIPNNEIWGGNPARFIKKLEKYE
jgi:acetyltransferase-like isoleucine patch superfamily enzyme